MHTTRTQRLIALAAAGSLLLTGGLALPGMAAAQQAAPQSATQPAAAAQGQDAVPTEVTGSDVEPKFIWGFLINFVVSKLASAAFDTFTNWLTGRMSAGLDKGFDKLTASMFSGSGARLKPRAATGVVVPPQVVPGNPDATLVVSGDQANFQGVHIAIAIANPDGSFGVRPVTQGFRTGERFKLRVVATFDGELNIENINPAGERKQVYPANGGEVVQLVSGKQALVPLGENQFFQFTGRTGQEQLVITLRDPRASGQAASLAKVSRQDKEYGSNFLQEVKPGTFPVISQAIELEHR